MNSVIVEEIDRFKKLLKEMSYYNAAEGDWRSERGSRVECRRRLRDQGLVLEKLGVDVDGLIREGSYLVGDWR